MKKILSLSLVLFPILLFSQNISITYNVRENKSESVISTNINYNLIIKKNESIFFNNINNDSLKQFNYSSLINDVKRIGELTRVKLSDNHYAYIKQDVYYKNYQNDSLVYNDIIFNKKVIVGESMELFKWEVQPKSDTLILKFKCQKAVTSFRGRTYEAYFSNEIGPYGGPWKFDGLPGTILSVKSLDNYFIIEPVKISLNAKLEETVIVNPYKKEEIICWNDFKSKYKIKLTDLLKQLKSKSEDGETGGIKIEKIEDLEIQEMKF